MKLSSHDFTLIKYLKLINSTENAIQPLESQNRKISKFLKLVYAFTTPLQKPDGAPGNSFAKRPNPAPSR